ncbi:MAG TPA: hypothetical protein VJK03_01945 [Candidatus Nanoarchaeia archaeon]|nr:hypothetical protein [Candidatus Nanoarchaeia archaeon]
MSARHITLVHAKPNERPYVHKSMKTLLVATTGALMGEALCRDSRDRFYYDDTDFNNLYRTVVDLPKYFIDPHGELQFKPETRSKA